MVARTFVATVRTKALVMAGTCAISYSTVLWGSDADRTPALDDSITKAGALSYESAVDASRLEGDLRISPDGSYLAYQIYKRPSDFDPARMVSTGRLRSDGTPFGRVGMKVYLTSTRHGEERVACDIEGDTWAPSWSPDGTQLALYSNAHGSVNLWMRDMMSGTCRRVSDARIKARHWEGDEVVWAPNGKVVYVPLQPDDQRPPPDHKEQDLPSVDLTRSPSVYAFRTDHASGAEQSPGEGWSVDHYLWENNASLAAVDTDGGAVSLVVPHRAEPRPSVLRLAPSGRWLSYLSVMRQPSVNASQEHDLVVMPSKGGDSYVIFRGEPVSERDPYRLSYQWHPTQDRLIYLAGGALWVLDFSEAGPGKPRNISSELGELAEFPLLFTRDGRSAVVGVNPDSNSWHLFSGTPAQGIAVIPLDGGPAITLAIDERRWSFSRVLQTNSRTAWQPDKKSLNLLLTDRAAGNSAIARVDISTGHQSILWEGTPVSIGTLASGPDHQHLYVSFENFKTPRNVYRFDANFVRSRRLTNVEPSLQDVRPGMLHVFHGTVPQFDGTLKNVQTAVILPDGAKPGDRLPAIVMFYPGLDVSRACAAEFGGGNLVGVPTSIFTGRGFAVVCAHVTTGPGREAGNVINEIVDSLMPQVYRAADLGYVDIARLGLAGQSFGAFATAAVLTRTTLFRAAMASNGPYHLSGALYGEFARLDDSSTNWMTWVERMQPRIGNHVWADLRRVIDNSPFYQADKIRTPLFIAQGIDDMGFSDAQRMYSALKRLGRPARLALYEQSGHGMNLWPRANAIDGAKRAVAFFREYLEAE